MNWVTAIVGKTGAWIIYRLISIFGRTFRWEDVPWLMGPLGGDTIGEAPYREVAAAEGLLLERSARDGGLVPSFDSLRSVRFDPAQLHPLVREFYEHTSAFAMDVWSQTYFPMSIGLKLMVTTISRMVDQLNFPVSPLDTAQGMTSEIILLREPSGEVRYTGWFRKLTHNQRVIYTGFYMTSQTPNEVGPSVKVVFPMPNGNATVLLRPGLAAGGSLTLQSGGRRIGDAGFYRLAARGADSVRVWYVRSLQEAFKVYVDSSGVLRCDHSVRFLGLPVLRLHYKIFRRT